MSTVTGASIPEVNDHLKSTQPLQRGKWRKQTLRDWIYQAEGSFCAHLLGSTNGMVFYWQAPPSQGRKKSWRMKEISWENTQIRTNSFFFFFSSISENLSSCHTQLRVPPLAHYFHSWIVLSAFCSTIVIQIVLVVLPKHGWVTVPALKSLFSWNKPLKFSTQDKIQQLQL